MVCKAHDLSQRVPSVCRCGVGLRNDLTLFLHAPLGCLIVPCTLSRMARQSLSLVVTCRFSLCVKPDGLAVDVVLGVSICDSENPEQKPRILSVELEEMLICVWTREPTQMMTRSCPIIPTPSLFLLLTRTQPLDYCVPLNPHFFSSPLTAPYSPVLFT